MSPADETKPQLITVCRGFPQNRELIYNNLLPKQMMITYHYALGCFKKMGNPMINRFQFTTAKINNPGAAGFQGAHGRSGDSESLGPCGWEAEPNRWWQNRNGLGVWWPPTCDLETNQGWTNPKFRYWRCVIEHWLLFIVVGSANCGELPQC